MSYCVYSGSDVNRDHVGRAHIDLRVRTGYKSDGEGTFASPAAQRFNATFYSQCAHWANDLEDLYKNWVGYANFSWVGHVGIYGHCSTSGSSMHHYGRAFDLGRVQMHDGWFVDTNWSWRQGRKHKRRYLAVAAKLRCHFKTVLTYHYNSDHHNHIHFDNGESLKPITESSKCDTQLIQWACNLQNGESLSVDGVWGSNTEAAFKRLRAKMQLKCTNIRGNLDDTKVFLGQLAYDAASNFPAGSVTWGVC